MRLCTIDELKKLNQLVDTKNIPLNLLRIYTNAIDGDTISLRNTFFFINSIGIDHKFIHYLNLEACSTFYKEFSIHLTLNNHHRLAFKIINRTTDDDSIANIPLNLIIKNESINSTNLLATRHEIRSNIFTKHLNKSEETVLMKEFVTYNIDPFLYKDVCNKYICLESLNFNCEYPIFTRYVDSNILNPKSSLDILIITKKKFIIDFYNIIDSFFNIMYNEQEYADFTNFRYKVNDYKITNKKNKEAETKSLKQTRRSNIFIPESEIAKFLFNDTVYRTKT